MKLFTDVGKHLLSDTFIDLWKAS